MEPIKPKNCKTVRGVARALLKLYEDPKRWTRGTSYRDEYRHRVFDPNRAVKCCVSGGVRLFGGGLLFNSFVHAFEDLSPKPMTALNDEQGLEAVRAVLRKMAK